ncbi:MAG: ribosome small subunit-dependent GTPase A [Oscillospiraceae bacterium]|jgi:ribosome small subunit-dependent GTPase A|nr:putative ribosome biogenesis GTPase RsgA [Firmicutes bacterium CAG:124]
MEEYRIIKALSGFYYVQTEDGVVECRARGRFRRQDQSPLVGDFVRITRQGDKGVLEALLPRKNAFIRPAVANIDQLVVLASCAIPVTEPFLIDRVLAIAQLQNVPALVVVNKDDLAPAQPLAEIYRRAGVPVLVTSAETGEGIEALREALAGKLSCLTGNSGVGKSSLLNRACPQLQLPVGEVSEKLGRGRHTTRHIELYSLGSNTFVADTPGFSAFDTERMELVHKEQLQYAFPEFAPYLGHCQFPDCAHRKEPGCAVRKALAEGKIGQTRYSSYERLYELASQLKEWELK